VLGAGAIVSSSAIAAVRSSADGRATDAATSPIDARAPPVAS
jgi:hypothetical protein